VEGLHKDLHHATNALAALSRMRNCPEAIGNVLVPFIKLRLKILDKFNHHSNIIDNYDKCPGSRGVTVLESPSNSASLAASFLENEKFANQALVHFESLKCDKNCGEMKAARIEIDQLVKLIREDLRREDPKMISSGASLLPVLARSLGSLLSYIGP
jgi:hypothetical protein